MSVDLSNYVDVLRREIANPGMTEYTSLDDDFLTNSLSDGFWEARLDGMLPGFTADDNAIVTPLKTGPDIGRDLIQLVVLYASFRILRNILRNLRTQFASTAGPVKFEYQQSANLIVELMKDVTNRRNILLSRLSDLGVVNDLYVDSVISRDLALRDEVVWWVGSDSGYAPYH